jgi:DNA polymerase-3 subunit epsilon
VKAFLFDTETTGLVENHTLPLSKLPEIVEFYGCMASLETGEIEAEIDTLIKPKTPIPIEVSKKNGITNEMLETAAPFAFTAPDIKRMIEEAQIVMAHNLSFDMEMVDIEFERLGGKIAWPRPLCTIEATVHLTGKRLILTAVIEHLFGKGFPKAHRAKNDVMAMLACAVELRKRGEI